MARTAPVPNIPPIPGMCPGIAVLGGGAGSGGGAGKGAGGGGAGGANGGEGGADTASGDGRGGDACGQGGPASCTQCGSSISVGHPVDGVTGRVTTQPHVDLSLPGPLPLQFVRTYSTDSYALDAGLGPGWSHSLGWWLEEKRRHVALHADDGRQVNFDRVDPGAAVLSKAGWELERTTAGYRLDKHDGVIYTFELARQAVYRLARIHDRYGNAISLTYDPSTQRLTQIEDSVGRLVRIKSTTEGRIAALEVRNGDQRARWVTMARYEYDAVGFLVAYQDADGYRWTFGYDAARLVRETDPTGLAFHFLYDRHGRCVETWGDGAAGLDLGLADDVPDVLMDGAKARGIHHTRITYEDDGYREIVTAVRIVRLFGNDSEQIDKGITDGGVTTRAYDAYGHVVGKTDPEGGTTRYTRDRQGRLLALVDPVGRRTELHRDASGRLLEAVDPAGNVWRLERMANGDIARLVTPRGAIYGYEYDARGLCTIVHLPNGGRISMEYDGHGNLTRRVEPDGSSWIWEYDYVGRSVARTAPDGYIQRVSYTDGGRPTTLSDSLGRVSRWSVDGVGQINQRVDPDGSVWKFRWGGHRRHLATTAPNGSVIEQRYDREGRLVVQRNERGEEHRRELAGSGLVLTEETFDGRRFSYRYDLVGRLVRQINTSGQILELEYNPAGDLIKRSFDDGSEEQLEYNPRGDLVRITGMHTILELLRNEIGEIVAERHTAAGQTHEVRTEFDVADDPILKETSLGHREERQRDAMGRLRRSILDGGRELIDYEYDARGRRVGQRSSRGAALRLTFDELGRRTRAWVETGATPSEQDGPQWVGESPGQHVIEKRYAYDTMGELISKEHVGERTIGYSYDAIRRLMEVMPTTGATEQYQYDATGNHYVAGSTCQIAAGDRVMLAGDLAYRYDLDGQVVERERRSTGEIWSYSWNAAGDLAGVRCPDGTVVAFLYDAFHRRVAKTVRAPGLPVAETHYLWDGDALVQERRQKGSVTEIRTYLGDGDRKLEPWAHRFERQDGDATEQGGWVHYLTDENGAPEELFSGRGAVLVSLRHATWGGLGDEEATHTPFRFAGQYEDLETGLFYNRHRYYDPESGRYLSSDPVGLRGSLNAYAYALNPVGWIDPLGLHNAQARLYPPGGQGPGERVTNPATGTTNFPNTPGNRDLDSERHVLNALEGRSDLNNSTLVIQGDCHSCPSCQAAMENFARENNMRVMYQKHDSDMIFDADFRDGGSGTSNRDEYERRRQGRVRRARRRR